MRVGVVLMAGEAGAAPAREAISLARELAGAEAETYLLGAAAQDGAPGAGKVVLGWHPQMEGGDLELLFAAAARLLGDDPPAVILFPEGGLFEAVGARLAGRCGLPAVRDVERVELAGNGVTVRKGAFGGKAAMTLEAPQGAVLALRGGVFAAGGVPEQAVECRDLSALETAAGGRRIQRDAGGDDLGQAKVIVSGGRGLGSREAYEGLTALAALLGGALGASRAAVDEGWASPARQVGITGRKVAPELYLAIGISGASQHLSGISGSRLVIAVNRDEKAPIFEAADLGVVADWHELWPQLRKALEG